MVAETVLTPQGVVKLLTNCRMIHIGKFAPIGKPFIVGGYPLDRLPLEKPVIVARGFFYGVQIENCFVPSLS